MYFTIFILSQNQLNLKQIQKFTSNLLRFNVDLYQINV